MEENCLIASLVYRKPFIAMFVLRGIGKVYRDVKGCIIEKGDSRLVIGEDRADN